MTLAAVCTVANDADVISWSVRHLLAEGVDAVWLAVGASYDGTEKVAKLLAETEPRVHVIPDSLDFHDQPYWTGHLGGLAHCDWILPFDADEFMCPADRGSLAQTFASLPTEVNRVDMPRFLHHSWDRREVGLKSMWKVAYRWNDEARVGPGNHWMVAEGPGRPVFDAVRVREIPFRSFDQFTRKVDDRTRTIDPSFPFAYGAWHRRMAREAERTRRLAWDRFSARRTIFDPIPSHLRPPSGILGA